MSYIDTSIIIAALDPKDHRSEASIKLLKEEKYKVISELTLGELASVISRREELVSDLADKLDLTRELTVLAILLYIMRRFNIKYRVIEDRLKITPLGKIYKPIITAVEISPALKLKTLDLLHISYIKLLKEEGEPIYKLITADTEFEKAEEYLKEEMEVDLLMIN